MVEMPGEESKKKKQQQNSMVVSIVFMIIMFSLIATLYPTSNGEPIHMEYVFFGVIVAFMIVFIFSKGAIAQRKELQHTTSDKKAYRNCPRCGRAITFEVNVCPYCERRIR